MAVKKELIVYMDIGLIGTFVAWEPATDDRYVYLKYVPMNSFGKNVIKYEKPIPKNAIHSVDPILQLKGVPDRIIFIYTEEPGSIVERVMKSDYVREINELRKKNESLEMKNTSLTQQIENARAGVSKSLSDARSLTRSREGDSPSRPSLFGRFGEHRGSGEDFEFD